MDETKLEFPIDGWVIYANSIACDFTIYKIKISKIYKASDEFFHLFRYRNVVNYNNLGCVFYLPGGREPDIKNSATPYRVSRTKVALSKEELYKKFEEEKKRLVEFNRLSIDQVLKGNISFIENRLEGLKKSLVEAEERHVFYTEMELGEV